jgi:hypothetical protein
MGTPWVGFPLRYVVMGLCAELLQAVAGQPAAAGEAGCTA